MSTHIGRVFRNDLIMYKLKVVSLSYFVVIEKSLKTHKQNRIPQSVPRSKYFEQQLHVFHIISNTMAHKNLSYLPEYNNSH